jgi:GAF domain-containing protein
MLTWIRQLLAAPIFEDDEDKTRVARLLNAVLLAFLAAVAIYGILAVFLPNPEAALPLVGSVIVMGLGALALMRRGRVQAASWLFSSAVWFFLTVVAVFFGGVSGPSFSGYVIVVVAAGLLLGGRGGFLFAGLSIIAGLGLVLAESSGVLPTPLGPNPPIAIWAAVSLFVVLAATLLLIVINSLDEALKRERSYAAELEERRARLERTIEERTRDLQRRTLQWQAATEGGRAITSILDPEQLFWQVSELIQERFDLYHVGLFQLDAAGEWAEYRAGAGEGARSLAEEGFRLGVGGRSMVGWCTANSQARVAQDVSTEAERVDHPLVSETRSEAALPLIARGQIIGALSVQSRQIGTFDPDTVVVLQAMADQVAVALDNARLFQQAQQSLEAERRAYGELSREAWLKLLHTRLDWGYSYAQQSVAPARGDWQPEMLEALQTGQTVQGKPAHPGPGEGGDGSTGPTLAIPVKVRDEVIGVLGFYKDTEDESQPERTTTEWTPEEARLLERLVDQLGLALESAQFYEDTQRRALREQAIRQVTEQMRRSVEVEAILQSTVTELARALGAPRAYVRLGTEAELQAGGRAVQPEIEAQLQTTSRIADASNH